MTHTLHVVRRGGFAGSTRRAQVTDDKTLTAILAELATIPVNNKADAVRDAFIYTFRLDIGEGDASGHAERNLREQHMTANLRVLVRGLDFGA